MSQPPPGYPRGDSPVSCPQGCVCGLRDLVTAAYEADERQPTEVDNVEMRAMLGAVRGGYDAIRRDERLAKRRHAAQTAYARARRGLDMLETRLATGTIGTAAAVARTAAVRAAAGVRRPRWLRVIRWPVVIAVGAFDAWYFMQVFRFLTSYIGDAQSDSPETIGAYWESVVPFVPGVVLAVALAACSVLLLMPLRAWRQWTLRDLPVPPPDARRGARGRVALARGGSRVVRLAWWLLPILFVGALLTVVAVWAGLRARYPVPPRQGYPLVPVMLLITMLSLAAIVTKILADDPVADDDTAARRNLRRRRLLFWWQSRRADILIARYESAWSDLRTLRDELVGVLRLKMLSAWEDFILRTRALHRRAGNVTALPVAPPVGREPALEGMILPEFENILQPRPELGPLHEICRLVEEQDPAELVAHREELAREYHRQLAGHGPAPGGEATRSPS